MKTIIDKLEASKSLEKDEFLHLLENIDEESRLYLSDKASRKTFLYFRNRIYLRGLIELTSYCMRDCLYCGIRKSNKKAERYRLGEAEILECCRQGYELGLRTFVLQGGEDPYYSDKFLTNLISFIKSSYPDAAVTLSLGERSHESYQRLYNAGADRYLLRHETANPVHFSKLHPLEQSLKTRMTCLFDLKSIGYQVGTGFMVGSPYQTNSDIVEDLFFIKDLQPQMVGIGPFLPHCDTPFRNRPEGSMELTLSLISILRLMIPNLLIPTTTALGTIDRRGRQLGIMAGANVIMPNLSPYEVRRKYMLYDNKINIGQETAEGIQSLCGQLKSMGYETPADRGDFHSITSDNHLITNTAYMERSS